MKTRRHRKRSYRSRGRRNPRGRSSRASRARSWHRSVRESLPWWERGRKNPRSGKARYHRGVLRKLSAKRRRGVIEHALGQMNPRRGRKGRGKHLTARGHYRKGRSKAEKKHFGQLAFRRIGYQVRAYAKSRRNPAQFPMPFVSAMNPGRRHRRGRRSRR